MVAEGKINPDYVRSDGTVVETNIHWPTDFGLCYDCCRTVGRIVNNARKKGLKRILKAHGVTRRFHVPKIKKLNFRINQNASAKSPDRKREYKRDYKLIVGRTEEYVQKAEEIVQILKADGSVAALAFAAELSGYLPCYAVK